MKIPIFPQFRHLEITDKTAVDNFTMDLPPYSDFVFSSLYSWDINRTTMISQLHGNLILKLDDYITHESRLALIGKHNLDSTTHELFNHTDSLELIGDDLIKLMELSDDLEIIADTPNHDYIISTLQTHKLEGSKFKNKREKVSKFHRDHQDHHFEIPEFREIFPKVESLFLQWAKNKQIPEAEYKSELTAMKRLQYVESKIDLLTVASYCGDELVGFSTTDKLTNGFGYGVFMKADRMKNGTYESLVKHTAKILYQQGIHSINMAQDLGIEGLRKHKMSWRPTTLLLKHIIKKRT